MGHASRQSFLSFVCEGGKPIWSLDIVATFLASYLVSQVFCEEELRRESPFTGWISTKPAFALQAFASYACWLRDCIIFFDMHALVAPQASLKF